MPRLFSLAKLCDKQGHSWRKIRPPSGIPFYRCTRCTAERGGTGNVADDIAATRLIEAAKAGKLAPDVAAGVLYLNKVRAEQSLVIRQLKNVSGYERLPPRQRRH